MKILTFLSFALLMSACSATGNKPVTNDLDYERSPCACADQPILFDGKLYTKAA